MTLVEIFDGVFKLDNKLATKNLVPGSRVYDEELKEVGGVEYRLWNPYRSKLAAALANKLKNMKITKGASVLYLGAATGTTCSHVSDIIEMAGSIYCVEISKRSMRDLLNVCEKRGNMFPIFEDARKIEAYADDVGMVDILYQDVSSPDQAELFLRNSALLKRGGYAYVAIKSQSIDVSRRPQEVFKEFTDQVRKELTMIEQVDIEPFDKMHSFVVFKKE